MSESAFDVISEYCIQNNIDFPARNQAYAIYTQKVKDAVENFKRENQGRITPVQEKTLQEMLISESEIEGYVASAQQVLVDIRETAVAPYKGSFRWNQFWISVVSSAVGALLYTIILILILFVAEEQVKSLIAPLVYEDVPETGRKEFHREQRDQTAD